MRTLVGKLGELGPGTHQVRITDIDLSGWSNNRLSITFVDSTDTSHHQMIFTAERGGESPSRQFTEFISAVLPSEEAITRLETEYANKDIQEAALTGLRNCKLVITLTRNSGFTIQYGDRGYAIQDADTGLSWTDDNGNVEVFTSIGAARNAAKKLGLKPSYTNISRYEAASNANNLEIFYASLSGINAAAEALGDTRLLFNPAALRSAT